MHKTSSVGKDLTSKSRVAIYIYFFVFTISTNGNRFKTIKYILNKSLLKWFLVRGNQILVPSIRLQFTWNAQSRL